MHVSIILSMRINALFRMQILKNTKFNKLSFTMCNRFAHIGEEKRDFLACEMCGAERGNG